MYAVGMIVGAYGQALDEQLRAKTEERLAAREREREKWEDEHLVPLMTAEAAAAFFAERRRQKERREDIKREERMHRERLAIERRKAAALERSASRGRYGFGLGVLLGTMIDGD